MIVRQPDGSLAAFHNVCRHRGAAFVTEWQGCGATEFKCPYHGWSYDLTGKVKGVPERIDFDPEHLKGLRSPQVAVDGMGRLGVGQPRRPRRRAVAASWIGDEIMADLGRYRMDDMILLDVLEWDVPVSYKAIVDGFNEIYHTAELHDVGKDWTKSARDTSFWIVNDHNYMCFVPRDQHRDKLEQDWDHHKWAICHYVVFPNTVFNCNPEHIQVFNPIPIDVDRTRFLCWEIVYPGDDTIRSTRTTGGGCRTTGTISRSSSARTSRSTSSSSARSARAPTARTSSTSASARSPTTTRRWPG